MLKLYVAHSMQTIVLKRHNLQFMELSLYIEDTVMLISDWNNASI